MQPKPQSEEYKAFEGLLGRVLSVSKSELQERLNEEKREKVAKSDSVSLASDGPSKQG